MHISKDPERHWFVFYTKSRQEKTVEHTLLKSGFEVFLPTQIVIKKWSDRKKKLEVPLFSSYIFVREFEYNIPEILKAPGIAWNIRYNGRPAILKQNEFELIKRFVLTGLFLETSAAENKDIKSGDHAEIIDGPLAGVKGVLAGEKHNLFSVQLESINQVIRVQIPAYLLKKC